MARHGALGQPSERGELPHGREATPGAVGEADEALHRPSEARLQRAVDVKRYRDKGKHGASGVRSTRPKAADFGRTSPVHAKGACEDSRFRGSSELQHTELPGNRTIADPPFEAGFAISGSGVAASRKWSRARSGFHAQRERASGLRGEQPGRCHEASVAFTVEGLITVL